MMSERNLFLNANGEPKLQPALVFYADILGWESSIKEAFATGRANEFVVEKRKILQEAYGIAKQYAKRSPSFDRPWLELKLFTDNIVLGIPALYGEESAGLISEMAIVFDIAANIQFHLAWHGMFMRGGIAQGMHYMDDDMAIGDALLEATKQDYKGMPPRIVLTDSCKKLLRFGRLGIPTAPFYDELLVDDDGADKRFKGGRPSISPADTVT